MKIGANKVSLENAPSMTIGGFDRFFASEGLRVFNYGHLDYNVQSLYETPQITGYKLIRAFCRMAGKPEMANSCVVDYLNMHEFQAYAATSKSQHFVALSMALPILVQTMFQDLVRLTNPFSEEEDYDDDIRLFPSSLDKGVYSGPELGRNIESILIESMPEERWQKILSTKLAEIAVAFCVAHEISHIVRGHTIIGQGRGMSSLAEVENGLGRRISDSVSQAWELQADRTAIAFIYSYVINTESYQKRLLKDLKCSRSGDPKIELMGKVVYAVSLVFSLLGQQQFEVDAVGTHPSAITRQTFVMAQVVTLLSSKAVGCDETEAERVVQRAATQASRAWERIGYRFGHYTDSVDNLPVVVKRMDRATVLCEKYLKHYGWTDTLGR